MWAKNTIIFLSAMIALEGASNVFANTLAYKRQLASINGESRISHAKELLGSKHYLKSDIPETAIYNSNLSKFILEYTEDSLGEKHKSKAWIITQSIIRESNRHGLDPLFLLAVLQHESKFNPDARGSAGEIGLMQLLPKTAQWISKMAKQKWSGDESLLDPAVNIKLGAQYLSYLRTKFGHGRLYLSAYNMGPKNVKIALAKNIWPIDYSSAVMANYLNFYADFKDVLKNPKHAHGIKQVAAN